MKSFSKPVLLTLALTLLHLPSAFAESHPREVIEAVAAIGADGVQRVEILAGSYFFKPNLIVLKVNVPVELKIRKEPGVAPHNIVAKAPEAGISFTVDLAKEPKTITFTPTKVGAFPIICDKRFLFFASHRDRGMEGVLDVRD